MPNVSRVDSGHRTYYVQPPPHPRYFGYDSEARSRTRLRQRQKPGEGEAPVEREVAAEVAGEAVGAAEPRVAYLRRVVAAWEQKYMAEHGGARRSTAARGPASSPTARRCCC